MVVLANALETASHGDQISVFTPRSFIQLIPPSGYNRVHDLVLPANVRVCLCVVSD